MVEFRRIEGNVTARYKEGEIALVGQRVAWEKVGLKENKV